MRAIAVFGLCLAMLVPTVASLALPAPAAAPATMQANTASPLWSALRESGRTPAQWAVLLTSDADGNHRTDFLDVLLSIAAATGHLQTPVELLVYADAGGRASLLATQPGATSIDGAGAVFLQAALSRVASLASQPGVSLVVWEPRAYVDGTSNNPASSNPAGLAQIGIHQGDQAWSAGYAGSGVKIAIIDTGADIGHQALDGGKVTAFKDCVGSGATSYDNNGHGTHVASIAAGDDGTDFRGIAYQADLVIVKVLDAAGSGSLAGFQCGITWLKNGGSPRADVASMSAGLAVPPLGITTLNGGETDLFGWDTVAQQLPGAVDMPFAIAAGNWVSTAYTDVSGVDETTHVGVNGVNQVSSPGFANGIIAVGAVDNKQAPASFTALGPGKHGTIYKPDVAAMGVDTWGAAYGSTSYYVQWSGTSMATPLAAGALALLVDKDNTLTYTQYNDALRNGAGPGCIVALSGAGCLAGLNEVPDPNFVVGFGVVKAKTSLDLI